MYEQNNEMSETMSLRQCEEDLDTVVCLLSFLIYFQFSLKSPLNFLCRKEHFMFNNDRTHKVWSERVRITKTEPAVSDPAVWVLTSAALLHRMSRVSNNVFLKMCVIIFPEHQITFMQPVIKHKRPISLNCVKMFFHSKFQPNNHLENKGYRKQ